MWRYFWCHKLHFLTKMFAIKFSIEWNIFLEVRRWLNTNNIGGRANITGKTRFSAIKVFTYLDFTTLLFIILTSICSQFVRKRSLYNKKYRNQQSNKYFRHYSDEKSKRRLERKPNENYGLPDVSRECLLFFFFFCIYITLCVCVHIDVYIGLYLVILS